MKDGSVKGLKKGVKPEEDPIFIRKSRLHRAGADRYRLLLSMHNKHVITEYLGSR